MTDSRGPLQNSPASKAGQPSPASGSSARATGNRLMPDMSHSGVMLDGPDVSTRHVLLIGSDAFIERIGRRFTQARLVVKTSSTADYLLALGQVAHVQPDVIIGQVERLGALRNSVIAGLRRLAPQAQLIVTAEPDKEALAIGAVEAGFDDYLLEPLEAATLARVVKEKKPLENKSVAHDTHATSLEHAAKAEAAYGEPYHPLWTHDHTQQWHNSAAVPPAAAADQQGPPNAAPSPVSGSSVRKNVSDPASYSGKELLPKSEKPRQGGSDNRYPDDPFEMADEELGDIDLVDCLMKDPSTFGALVLKLVTGRSGVTGLEFSPEAGDVPQKHVGAWVTYQGRRLGVLHAPPPAMKSQLAPWASWVGHWYALHEQMTSLWEMANKDELTGAWNRRFFDRHLSRVIAQAAEKRFPVTLLVFDIDNFKTYNDGYGHAAGDEILRETVRLMKSVIREHDVVARIGGDEFAVIFWDPHGPRKPNSSHPDDVRDAARRFQQAICAHHFPKLLEEAPGTLTISGGLASFPWDGRTAQSLIERADTMLLHSKSQGKNAITFGSGAMRSGDPFEHDA